jgi:hypothetical protein
MIGSGKAVALAAAFAVFVAPLADASAQTRKHYRNYAYKQGYRPVPTGNWNYGTGYGYGYSGDYGRGWRLRDNAKGWDNTCIDAPWLPSQFACSPGR